jgi:hypothetical protein
MGTKNNPGDFDCYAKLAPDEPYFIVRGQDILAPGVVRRWATLALEAGVDRAKIAEAERVAYDMERYQQGKKVPD